MTLNEFRDKYGVNYSIVYAATFMVQCDDPRRRDREYNEKALKEAVIDIVTTRIEKYHKEQDRYEKILEQLTEI